MAKLPKGNNKLESKGTGEWALLRSDETKGIEQEQKQLTFCHRFRRLSEILSWRSDDHGRREMAQTMDG
jgi:hypothetical protein